MGTKWARIDDSIVIRSLGRSQDPRMQEIKDDFDRHGMSVRLISQEVSNVGDTTSAYI